MTILELAERCEQATGPDRDLDTGIAKALGLTDQRTHMSPQGLGYVDRNQWAVANVARYTASLDAAMTLRGVWLLDYIQEHEGDRWTAAVYQRDRIVSGAGKTPALALCAAALLAGTIAMPLSNYCKPCGEFLLPEDTECPFCGQMTTPVDELAS